MIHTENPAYSQPGLSHWVSVTHWPYGSQTCRLCPHPMVLALLLPSALNNVHPDIHMTPSSPPPGPCSKVTLGGSPHPAQPRVIVVLSSTGYGLAHCYSPLLRSTLHGAAVRWPRRKAEHGRGSKADEESAFSEASFAGMGAAGGQPHMGMAQIK